jgi:hypothetical protein
MDISSRHRDRVIEAVTSAADPLLRVSKVDDVAVEDAKNDLREAFNDAEILAGDTFTEQRAIAQAESSDELRPEVLNERRDALEKSFGTDARDVTDRIAASRVRLAEALKAVQVPRSGSDTAALLAREEVKLAIAQARKPDVSGAVTGSPRTEGTAADIMVQLARGGGETAAVVASPWGRLLLQAEGQVHHHADVVEAAIAASGDNGAEARETVDAAVKQLPALDEAAATVRSALMEFGLSRSGGYGGLRDRLAGAFA